MDGQQETNEAGYLAIALQENDDDRGCHDPKRNDKGPKGLIIYGEYIEELVPCKGKLHLQKTYVSSVLSVPGFIPRVRRSASAFTGPSNIHRINLTPGDMNDQYRRNFER